MNLVTLKDTKLIYRNLLHFYTLVMNNQKEKLRKSHLQSQKNYIVINLTKVLKDLYSENYKTLMKEIEENTNR